MRRQDANFFTKNPQFVNIKTSVNMTNVNSDIEENTC